MKVLVIGGAGYIGSHVVYELIKDNHEVVVVDNLSTGLREMIHKDAKFYLGDITDKRQLTDIFKAECGIKPFDVVMHFAAKLIVPESVEKPLEYYYNNVEGVRIMLEVMTEFNIKNVVFSSTAAVYGNPIKPVCEEEDPTLPINPYGASKLASEEMIKWVCKRYNMNYCIFRYFNVAGADESLEIGLKKDNLTHLIPVTIQTALGIREKMQVFGNDYNTKDGTCIRDYIHVSDLAIAPYFGC
jgi:UDP-glucose 4-epimerase